MSPFFAACAITGKGRFPAAPGPPGRPEAGAAAPVGATGVAGLVYIRYPMMAAAMIAIASSHQP